MAFSIGIDYGTGSGRVFLIDTDTGQVKGSYVKPYSHGTIEKELNGIRIPHSFALQHAGDYLEVLHEGIPAVLKESGINSDEVKGIGIDFTSSTVIFVDHNMLPLHMDEQFKDHPHAYVKLWKHHGAQKEAEQLYQTAIKYKNRWLGHYGFNVSSEWMIPKIMEVVNEAPEIIEETAYIMEAGDWVVNYLTGKNIRSNCGLGFKAFYEEGKFHYDLFDEIGGGLSDVIRSKVDYEVVNIGQSAGCLTADKAAAFGLNQDVQVAPFIIDAHSSLLGIGSERDGQMTMVMGTSTCHLMLNKEQKEVPGISGSVKDAIIPGLFAYEAGQSAVGDLFEYGAMQAPYAYVKEAEERGMTIFELLDEKAGELTPGESGLIALDWHNGNRSVLSDSLLKGALFGLTLKTRHEEIYRAYLEATAYGTKMIMQQYEGWGMHVEEVFACGGIPKKSRLLMEIYANVLNKTVTVIDSEYAPAIGAAILGAVAGGVYSDVETAAQMMKQPKLYDVHPDKSKVESYEKLFSAYKELHDLHGYKKVRIMKNLLKLEN